LCYTASGIATLCRWPSGAHRTATYSVEAYNKLITKQAFVHEVG